MRSFRRREPRVQPEHQEIDLFNLAVQLWKGKKIIICTMIVALGIAIAYLSVQKKTWVSTAVVSQPDSGQVANYTNTMLLLYPSSARKEDATNTFLPSISDIRAAAFERFSILLTARTTHGPLNGTVNTEILKVEQPQQSQQSATTVPVQLNYVGQSPEQLDSKLKAFIEEINKGVEKQLIDDLKANIAVRKQELTAALVIQDKLAKQQRAKQLEQTMPKSVNGDTAQENVDPMISQKDAEWSPDYADEYISTQEQLLRISALNPEKMKIDSFYYVTEPGTAQEQGKKMRAVIILLSLILGALGGGWIVLVKNALRHYKPLR